MRIRFFCTIVLTIALVVSACTSSSVTPETSAPTTTVASSPTSSSTAVTAPTTTSASTTTMEAPEPAIDAGDVNLDPAVAVVVSALDAKNSNEGSS